jgi:uncharacterized protein with GYD domain
VFGSYDFVSIVEAVDSEPAAHLSVDRFERRRGTS